MSGDNLKYIKPGAPMRVSAGMMNAFIDTTKAFRRRNTLTGSEYGASGIDEAFIRVQNDTGATLERFQVVGIGSPAIAPTSDTEPAAFFSEWPMMASVPSAAHRGSFAVMLDGAANGTLAIAKVAGDVLVKVDVTDETHRFAEVITGDVAKLSSGATGSAQILWKESGTGTKWALVRLGNETAGSVEYGSVSTSFTSGTQIELAPSDIAGVTVSGASLVSAFVKSDQSAYTLSNSTTIASGTVVPYGVAGDGNRYTVGTLSLVQTGTTINGSTMTLSIKTRDTAGLWFGSESDWVDVHTGNACTV
jgi:hypothetical protein